MTWNAKGEDRAKSYRVYRELEERYRAEQALVEELQSRLAEKNQTIRQLADELAQALQTPGKTTHTLAGLLDEVSDAFQAPVTGRDTEPPKSVSAPSRGLSKPDSKPRLKAERLTLADVFKAAGKGK